MSLSNLRTNQLLVADTSPLLALARLNCLTLLGQLFSSVCVTQSVISECLAKPESSDSLRIKEALADGRLITVDDPVVRSSLKHLDAGEMSALEYALRESATILIDERAGRLAAKAHHLTVVGTLGILLLAKQKGFLPLIKPTIYELKSSGYFISENLIAYVLELANE
jgi:uncharacterized protein